ncbi:hypothetical protein DPMN_007533 [Dreissena polymorpha]|uniref:Uncharacterized protein n=1 Tax=Dreissena polymorpha TaxID=45954 RepID=A0A9D4RYG2_DREPO|nr:hypothetical protein DPMN_006145 [Dreissena polymorpha]KAH3883573.1 hypothetical protein DPMN_007533 [Dreissena polymorpha]
MELLNNADSLMPEVKWEELRVRGGVVLDWGSSGPDLCRCRTNSISRLVLF